MILLQSDGTLNCICISENKRLCIVIEVKLEIIIAVHSIEQQLTAQWKTCDAYFWVYFFHKRSQYLKELSIFFYLKKTEGPEGHWEIVVENKHWD